MGGRILKETGRKCAWKKDGNSKYVCVPVLRAE
jgi:hypothetical protein